MRHAHRRETRTDRRGLRCVVATLALLLAATGPLFVALHGADPGHHHGVFAADFGAAAQPAPAVDPGHPASGVDFDCPICAHGQVSQRTLVSSAGIPLPTPLSVSRHESLRSETRAFGPHSDAPESPRAPPLAS